MLHALSKILSRWKQLIVMELHHSVTAMRLAQSREGFSLCFYFGNYASAYVLKEDSQNSNNHLLLTDKTLLLPGIPPNISPLTSPCHSPLQGTPATSPTGKTSSVSFPDSTDTDTKQGLKPHKVLTATQSAPSLSEPNISPSVICSR